MPSLIQNHAHVNGQRSSHNIFKFQPNPSWAKKRPNRYMSFGHNISTRCSDKMQISFFLPRVGYFGFVLGMEKSSNICI